MKTALLKSDGFIKAGTDYADYLAQVLKEGLINYDILDLTLDDLPLDEYSAFVLTGGSTPASAEIPWMRRTVAKITELCAAAIRGDIFLLGICLGSQIIANAYAGKKMNVASNNGLEFGFRKIREVETAREYDVLEFHYEEIADSFLQEPGVRLTHSNRHSLVQGYSIGDNIQAYQFHPEIPPQALDSIATFNASLLAKFRVLDRGMSAHITDQGTRNETFILTPLRRFLVG